VNNKKDQSSAQEVRLTNAHDSSYNADLEGVVQEVPGETETLATHENQRDDERNRLVRILKGIDVNKKQRSSAVVLPSFSEIGEGGYQDKFLSNNSSI
jgi:hypothetical protein